MSDEIRELFNKHGVALDRDDVWSVQSSRVVKHKALERLAAALHIKWSPPQVLRSERDEAVILVTGACGDASEWSIGEALVNANYRVTGKMAPYVYAMAEKRAKDRVIIKLAGLHGVYSEDEADDFKQRQGQPEPEIEIPADQKADTIKAYIAVFKEAVSHAQTVEELRPMWKEGDYARGKLGIVPASTVHGDLYALWVARGKELSSAHNITREAAE